ncbi:hypothetical protein PSEUBRA_004174 [Kalmanozyma brasiliensis GHG001]|uniref:Uncharacterized protein n=1 Tax=Kalmanozyma brasiliensis (strain GHG001) TaxID=1365824 RepID=V5ETC6_KALBG|nr:uncharacterized protein PSEUBRA_004174 [Kalmanozyma brasiliensis GHG001]EST06288.1 hypothetical protein PSEUBRA_004174 [Kalmanozyma brasiliensis GHG001]
MPPCHAQGESDEYEERDLGEIAAANQAAQEQRWGPHAAPSEAPARYDFYADQLQYVGRYVSMPIMPGSLDPTHYDGGFYVAPPASGAYEPMYEGYNAPSYGAPSIASRQTLGGRSRHSLPAYSTAPTHPSVSPPASEPPNIFNVNAAHHLPGTSAHPQDAQHGGRIGDSLPGFPSWSHAWYGGHLSADGHAYTMVPPGSGQSGWESESFSNGRYGPQSPPSPYGPYPYDRTPTNDQVKEERIRMLEKQFGPKVSRKGRGDGSADDEEEEPEEVPIGGVNAKGRLVLPRHKLRIATRWLQCLVSLGAAGMGIGGFILIRPADKAPPSGTFPSFVLYGVSVISTLVCLWLFAFKPCCCSGRDPAGAGAMGVGAQNGMVIPVMTSGNGGGKAGKKNKMHPGPSVNIIVDSTLLGKRTDDTDTESDSDAETLPGDARRRKKRRAKKRRQSDALATMKMQARWHVARKSLKWDCGWDVVLCLLWGTAAVMALVVGKKCPAGTGSGWCNLYNGAIACSVVATVLFLVAIYCDVVGLRASKAPPKTRA